MDGLAIFYNISLGDGSSQIYRLDMLSREQSLVLDCPAAQCRYPRSSPDGAWLAYERILLDGEPNYAQVWLLPLGEPEAEPYLAGETGHETLSATWSPDGWLAFRDNNESAFIFLNPTSGERQSFPSETGLAGVWSPDGGSFITSEIITAIEQNPSTLPNFSSIPSSHLRRFSRQDEKIEDLTQRANLEDAAPVYSPDGTLLAFGRKYLDIAHWTPGRQLWVMRPDGSEAQPLTDEPHHNHYDFAWHPSGNQIAYVRFNQTLLIEPPEVWIVEVGTGRARQLIAGGYSPQWIP
jgi:Tol biopolymer transport system component